MVSLAGKTLGKYRLIEQLGRGGFASVYKAYQARLDRYVAIKVLHPHLVEGEDFLVRFEREAQAVAGLRHPNIVIVHDFDVEDNIYYMVMEYIDGLSLKQRLEALSNRQETMPFEEVLRIIEDISSALDYAHQREMLHRDVKPSNVILNQRGDSFLTDFGIARILSNSQFTVTGALIGTPAYMSPEQGQGQGVSPASDVYSLGVMLYEFLTGHVPFDADTPLAIIFKHIRDPLPSVHTFRSDLPEGIEKVIYKSLAKDPQDRYQTPGELFQALQEALSNVQVPDFPSPEPERTPESLQPEPPVETASGNGVERLTPSEPLDEPVVDPESYQAPTMVDRRESDVHPDSPEKQKELATETPESDLEASKAPTLALEDESLDDQDDTRVESDEPISSSSLEADKAATVAVGADVEPAFEDRVSRGQLKESHLQSDQKKKRTVWKYVGIPGVILICIILLGVVLKGVFSSRSEETPEAAAPVSTLEPTRQPEPALKQEPAEIPGAVEFEHGMALLHEEENFIEAIQKFQEAEALGFRSADLYGNLGLACIEAQRALGECDFREAIHYFTQAIELDPEEASYYGGRGWAQLNMERWGEALDDYSRAIELDPEYPDYWANRGMILGILGDTDAAFINITHAVDMNPDEPWYWSIRADIFAQMGNLEAAIGELSVAIELEPDDPAYWETRGWYHLEMSDLDAALSDFDQAIHLVPGFIMAYVGKSHVYTRLGVFDAALSELGTAISHDPEHDGLYLERARLYWWHLEDYDSALQDLNTAVDLNPNNWEAFMNRGEIYANMLGEIDRGLQDLNRAVVVVPRGIAEPFFVRGLVYSGIENWGAAVEDFSMVIRITPDTPDGHGHRGYAFRQLGIVDKARADYEIFLELTAEKPEYEEWRGEVENWLSQNP